MHYTLGMQLTYEAAQSLASDQQLMYEDGRGGKALVQVGDKKSLTVMDVQVVSVLSRGKESTLYSPRLTHRPQRIFAKYSSLKILL